VNVHEDQRTDTGWHLAAAQHPAARHRQHPNLRQLWHHREVQRVAAFLFAGGLSAIVTLTVTSLLTELAHQPFLWSAIAGTELGILINFAANDRLAFHDLAGHRRPLPIRLARYHVTCATGQSLILLSALALHDLAGWRPIFAQALPIIIVTALNFMMHRFWTYRGIRQSVMQPTRRFREPLLSLTSHLQTAPAGDRGAYRRGPLLWEASPDAHRTREECPDMEITFPTSTTDETIQPTGDNTEPVFGLRNIIVAVALFCGALGSLIALQKRWRLSITGSSGAPHYVYQAWSLLHGHWNVDLPPQMRDIVVLHGKEYIVYPPFPAILMMPFVAIFGLSMSDILFTTVVSAFILSLLYLLFEQVRANKLTQRPWWENLIIAILCYYGSITLWLSLHGAVWFTPHIIGMACTLLSLLLAFRRHYAWSALLLGCAFLSRSTVIWGFPFLLYLAWQDGGTQPHLEAFVASLRARRPEWQAIPWRRLIPPTVVMGIVIGLFMVRDAILFGSPFETGYNILIHQRYPMMTTGLFNIHYIPANIIANFFSFPRVIFTGPFDRHPVIDMLNGGYGTSVFLTTPLFLLLFWRNKRFSLTRAMLWITLGIIVAEMLLFHAAGWYQFGARYLYEGYAYAFLLLVLNEVRVDWRFFALGLIGIGVNLLGAHQFWTHRMFRV
jgi:putative flippase GtrA